MIVYQIKPGFQVNRRYAQAAGEIMAELESEGRLTPAELVKVSRPEEAPLHGYFEWDDAAAAEKYRERQGTYLIQAVVEVRERPHSDSDGCGDVEVEVVKPFYAIEQNGGNYYHINTIVHNEDKSKKLLNMAYRELLGFERRYEIIKDRLSSVFTAIDELHISEDAL